MQCVQPAEVGHTMHLPMGMVGWTPPTLAEDGGFPSRSSPGDQPINPVWLRGDLLLNSMVPTQTQGGSAKTRVTHCRVAYFVPIRPTWTCNHSLPRSAPGKANFCRYLHSHSRSDRFCPVSFRDTSQDHSEKRFCAGSLNGHDQPDCGGGVAPRGEKRRSTASSAGTGPTALYSPTSRVR
jgi:hypothetical protein